MNVFTIKIVAVSAMLIDHVGLVFFPGEVLFRVVGRISFPLFAWLVANAVAHTKNIKNYIVRVALFAVVSQIPFSLLFFGKFWSFTCLNILFSFLISLLIIYSIKYIQNSAFRYLLLAVLLSVSVLLPLDYAFYGVLCVLLFHVFFGNFIKTVLSQFMLVALYFTVPVIHDFYTQNYQNLNNRVLWIIQPVSLISLSVIASYNKRLGSKVRYLFYVFYPAHLLILYCLIRALGRV